MKTKRKKGIPSTYYKYKVYYYPYRQYEKHLDIIVATSPTQAIEICRQNHLYCKVIGIATYYD